MTFAPLALPFWRPKPAHNARDGLQHGASRKEVQRVRVRLGHVACKRNLGDLGDIGEADIMLSDAVTGGASRRTQRTVFKVWVVAFPFSEL
ncbi:hypothetical protein PspLS_06608 [Pyricularia sp. CBS 133598]|nr:hypothetical protein PspLS_06608 [Pyricularia sp. CBS 133598]